MSCCVGAMTLALGVEVAEGNIFAKSDYQVAVTMSIGALAFVLVMVSLALIFAGFGLYLRNRKKKPLRKPVRRRVILLFFGLYIGAMILAAGIPGYTLASFEINIGLKIASIILGWIYFLYGSLMLWLSIQEYEHIAIDQG